MAKYLKRPVVLQIELTQYGWTLKEDGTSHGLFVSKDKAISRLKERQRALKADGRATELIVTSQEDPSRGSQSKWRIRGIA
jgi:hypothetical protein